METTIYHLIGPPAVGKYTIGKELAARSGARLVDNHSVANVLFNLLDQDGVTPLPDAIWPLVGQVRAAVIETLLTVSPPHLSFVFTNFMRGEDEREYAVFLEMVAVAAARQSLFVPVLAAMRSRRDCAAHRRRRPQAAPEAGGPCAGASLRDRSAAFRDGSPQRPRARRDRDIADCGRGYDPVVARPNRSEPLTGIRTAFASSFMPVTLSRTLTTAVLEMPWSSGKRSSSPQSGKSPADPSPNAPPRSTAKASSRTRT